MKSFLEAFRGAKLNSHNELKWQVVFGSLPKDSNELANDSAMENTYAKCPETAVSPSRNSRPLVEAL